MLELAPVREQPGPDAPPVHLRADVVARGELLAEHGQRVGLVVSFLLHDGPGQQGGGERQHRVLPHPRETRAAVSQDGLGARRIAEQQRRLAVSLARRGVDRLAHVVEHASCLGEAALAPIAVADHAVEEAQRTPDHRLPHRVLLGRPQELLAALDRVRHRFGAELQRGCDPRQHVGVGARMATGAGVLRGELPGPGRRREPAAVEVGQRTRVVHAAEAQIVIVSAEGARGGLGHGRDRRQRAIRVDHQRELQPEHLGVMTVPGPPGARRDLLGLRQRRVRSGQLAGGEQRVAQREQGIRALGGRRRQHLGRLAVELGGGLEVAAGDGVASGHEQVICPSPAERRPRRLVGPELAGIRPGGAEVVADDRVVWRRERRQPVGEVRVQPCSPLLRDRLVGGVPQEDVPEAERVVIGQLRGRRGHEPLAHQRQDAAAVALGLLVAGQHREGAALEDHALDRRPGDRLPLLRLEPADALL